MNKQQIAFLERAWEAEIAYGLKEQPFPVIQSQSKVAKKLCEEGYLDEVEFRHGPALIKGYQINHLGIMAYCESLPEEENQS